MRGTPDVTGLLLRWRDGDHGAFDDLVTVLYQQLKDLARARRVGERSDHTVNTTALVHEAYLKLVDIDRIQWQDRAHFLAMASKVMRRVLIDYAVRRNAQKRGGGVAKLSLDEVAILSKTQADTLLEIDDALQRLETAHPRPAQAMELYYLGGLTQEETAEAIGVSQPTVKRDLDFARAWLARAWKGDLSVFSQAHSE